MAGCEGCEGLDGFEGLEGFKDFEGFEGRVGFEGFGGLEGSMFRTDLRGVKDLMDLVVFGNYVLRGFST